MSDDKKKNTKLSEAPKEQLSLNDDRRVKVLSPGRLVAKRFFRNRLAVLGLVMLITMFVFSFLGGALMKAGQDEQFYTYDVQNKEFCGVALNNDTRYLVADGQEFGNTLQAQYMLNFQKGTMEYTYKDVSYRIVEEGTDLYGIYSDDTLLAVAYKDIVNAADGMAELSFTAKHEALKAYTNEQSDFSAEGVDYTLDELGNIYEGATEVGYISRFVVQAKQNGVTITRDFKEELEEALKEDISQFTYVNEAGEEQNYRVTFNADFNNWTISQATETLVYDKYASPSWEHLLGTDGNGMDMLVRLMYGGRVSLVIGFIVVFIETILGVIMGGIAGYFGGWIDNLIMRIVDIFYCIPSTAVIIILGSAMDAMRLDPQIRMLYLMVILGIFGWAGVARMVRGQILSLREQEFMTATEACGISVRHRIFKHLVPNVMPQLIVSCTMGLGSVILTEATLSFLGLGVKFPFASWGNIVSDVNNSYVMTTFWFVWIPAGLCLLITVLGFNFVGDGLRDAFDPKMKR